MIKYNLNTINDWFFSTDNIIKVYRNNAICYYKIDSSSPSGQTPCFAVVDDISQYSDTEFEDIFNKADGKWYKLNNLNQYEEYGVYGSGRTITYYEGKLTVDDGDDGEDYSTHYLTLVAQTDNVTFSYSTATSSNKLQYSVDSGSTWNDLSNGSSTSSINNGDRIMFKASGLTVNTERGIGKIIPSASASVEGNIMSLEYGDNFSGQTTIQNNYQFRKLFSGVTTITSAENMVLPATTVKQQCYSQMFQGCTNLVKTPKTIGSSAMTWSGNYCFSNLFSYCTSLTTVPSGLLPALNLGTQCYWYMFEGCSGLTTAPDLPATTTASQCYQGMFINCSSLNYITVLTTNNFTMNEWLSGVAASGTFVKNPNATWSSCGQNTYPCGWTVQDYVEPTPIKYEYIYSGGSWVNVGEVSGGTASLPDVSFMLNYNAKDYNASTHSIAKTSGQTRDVDAVCNYGYHIVDHSADGYITVTGNTRMLISGTTYMGRNNTQTGCTMTIVSKVRTTSGYSILTNRGRSGYPEMNWMWRYPTNAIFLHGSSSYNNPQYFTNTSTSPIVASVRTYYDGGVKQTLNDWTNNGSYSGNFGYGDNYNGNSALFCDYASSNIEFWQGDFYWVYMSQDVLTDTQIQQVIAYNEGGGGEPEYPMYYDELQDPPNNLTFSSMTEAEEYECPWVGMVATIDGVPYVFSGDSTSGYEWVEQLTAWYTLQDLINTHTVVSIGNNKFRFDPTVNGISYFRVHTDKVSGSGTFVDLYNDNLPSPPYFGIKDDSNITLYTSVDGYSNLKSAANSTSCTWAYWIDANTIEVNAQAIMNDTMNIGFYTGSFSKLLLSFELPIIS